MSGDLDLEVVLKKAVQLSMILLQKIGNDIDMNVEEHLVN
jgi:hypothetical protein